MSRATLVAVFLLGCAEGSDPVQDPQVGPAVLTDPDAPFLDDATTEPTAVDLDAVAVSVDRAIEMMLELDAAPLVDAYRNAMDGSEPGCPMFYNDGDVAYWLDTCTAGSGATYDGYGLDDVQLGIDLGDGMLTDISTMGGVGIVTGPSGHTVDVNGFAQEIVQISPDGLVSTSTTLLSGDFWTDDPVADGTWLSDGVVPNVYVTRYGIVGVGEATVASGVLEGLSGEFPTVVFDDALISAESLGITDCELEPTGSVSVQLPGGDWVDILFDPAVEGDVVVTEDASSCDGCGRAWHRTLELGPACFDFSPWLSR
jgi:hypothetical protein